MIFFKKFVKQIENYQQLNDDLYFLLFKFIDKLN